MTGEAAVGLKDWAMKMGVPAHSMPSDTAFRNLCTGRCRHIWKYVTGHISRKQTVKNAKGNLEWNRYLEGSVGESVTKEREKRRMLQEQLVSLEADLQQLEEAEDTEQQESDERALAESCERRQDLKQRNALLKAFLLRAQGKRKVLQEQGKKVGDRLAVFREIGSKAEHEVGISRSQDGSRHNLWHGTGQETEVLQDVRGACFGRFQFLKSLYNEQDRPTDRNGDGNHDLRRVMYQQWLSQVEGLNTTHPPNHILAALESLAAENKEELVELSSKVDVVKDMEALRFAYTSSHLQDVSEPTAVLRSVKSLLEEGWMECEVRAVEKIGAVRRERETSATLELLTREFSLLLEEQYGNSPQQLSITREALELEASVADRGTCLQELTEQGHLLAVAIQARNREIQTLQQKHARILDFQTLVEGKQDLIRALVKGNSSAKSHLMKTQNEIALFVATKLETHEQTIRSLTGDHHDSLAREVNLFAAISLPCLDRRVMHEVQRVPVHKLSIHRMDASINNPQFSRHLKNTLSFPLYKAPERLIGRAMELKMEVLALRVRLCHQREYLQSQHDVTLVTDAQALSQRVQEQNAECRNVTIPAIEQLLDQCNEAIGLTDVLRGEVQDWWEQPAQFVVPWLEKHGLNVQRWIHKWNQMVQQGLTQPALEAERRRMGPRNRALPRP